MMPKKKNSRIPTNTQLPLPLVEELPITAGDVLYFAALYRQLLAASTVSGGRQ